MRDSFVSRVSLPKFPLLEKIKNERQLVSLDLEITARCNNNCRHCYINLPARDEAAKKNELTLNKIKEIADQAIAQGALWCLLTGGEPLLREDFFEIYSYLKKKGLLVSVFTNASLISKKHILFFKKYPPRDVEVTVYGVTRDTYERVTRKSGSFDAFINGLNLLIENNIKVRFKTMALRSNVHEIKQIAKFCRQRTKDYFRFDPFLHLRFDRNYKKNKDIKSERLTAREIVALEQSDPERSLALEKKCNKLILPGLSQIKCNHLFHCNTGIHGCTVSYDGFFRLCSSLWHPDCIYDLRKGSLSYAWNNFVLKVRDMRSNRGEFLTKCRKCELFNFCMWCPANAYLETGKPDKPVSYFCEVAHTRAEKLVLIQR
jgi:radical SAM protein with 4Fe4S-binding SPASM domain